MQKSEIISRIRAGEVAVLPSESVYGLMASVQNKSAVERIYELKDRDPSKACIILIADAEDAKPYLERVQDVEIPKKHWPAKISYVMDVRQDVPEFLHWHFECQPMRSCAASSQELVR